MNWNWFRSRPITVAEATDAIQANIVTSINRKFDQVIKVCIRESSKGKCECKYLFSNEEEHIMEEVIKKLSETGIASRIDRGWLESIQKHGYEVKLSWKFQERITRSQTVTLDDS